ncbi:MAG: class I SAM-dependent methyltransferase [Desulfuromonadales bacterium]|nr:class I SAM-dependent methyltransferase [Desulfuromonadales bacterium]
MFEQLRTINQRPQPFSVYSAQELWTDPHVAQQMLKYHLNEQVALASRTKETIEASVAWMQRRFAIDENTAIADFGCGPGLYSSRLAQLGAQVTGIDFSANSIEYARQLAAQQQLSINYLQQNYLDFASERKFDLICMIMCDYCALSPQQRQQLLAIFRKHLKEDGALFLDVCSMTGYAQRQEQATYQFRQLDGFWADEDYYGFVNTFKYDDAHVALDKYSLFTAERSWVIYNWLQYFSLQTLTDEFEEAGLCIKECYSDVTGTAYSEDSTEIAIIARLKS